MSGCSSQAMCVEVFRVRLPTHVNARDARAESSPIPTRLNLSETIYILRVFHER